MAMFESDRRPFEVKGQLDHSEAVDIDLNAQSGPPLSNGNKFNDPSLTSVNSTAHNTNAHQDTDEVDAIVNGIEGNDSHQIGTQSSTDAIASLSNTGTTLDIQPPPSVQSAPEDSMDQSGIELDDAPLDPTPAVVQQPTSDLREETKPLSSEQMVEIMEQKEQQVVANETQSAHEAVADVATSIQLDIDLATNQGILATPAPEETYAAQIIDLGTAELSKEHNVGSAIEQEPSVTNCSELPHHLSMPTPEPAATEDPVDSAPSLASAAESSVLALHPEEPSSDHVMQDAPLSPVKLSREREDDDLLDGPVAKRSKTEEDSSTAADFKVPERPAIDTQVNGTRTEAPLNPIPITSAQHKALARIVANIKRIQSSLPFRNPVDYVALNIPSYPTIVKDPMDLKTLEDKLKANKYTSLDAFVTDFNLIVENCRTFNGPDHSVTKLANEMQKAFEKQYEKIPGPDVAEPTADKKKKTIVASASKAAPARRESRSSLPGSARSPVSASSQQTFALSPAGVPLIRRDSTVGDGRPKREIHPPAPRDLPYANQKPKKKKYQLELKFCDKVLAELLKPKYSYCNYPFLAPVDPVALNIPQYHSVIKKPMDLGTTRTKLDQGQYENAREFESDIRLVFQNCYRFNRPGDLIDTAGHQLENVFNSEFGKKRDFIEQNTPGSGPQSAGSSEADDSDEEEEEDDEEDDHEQLSQLQILQKQIAAMSRQVEMIQKKKTSPPAAGKKASKGSKPARKDSKKAAPVKVEKKAARPVKKEKAPYVSYEQKQDISNRINSLPENKMATALKIIRDNMPNLKGVQEDELELDIDELSDEVLHKLLLFVRKHAPRADDSPTRPAPASSSAAPTRKKNKPMSKTEQEARIAQVQSGLSAFQNPGAANSYDEPAPGAESSDGQESSESEEE